MNDAAVDFIRPADPFCGSAATRSPSISVITATRNCSMLLPTLIASLRGQTDQDFEWVVMDGASTDTTLAIVEASSLPQVVLESRIDNGIYDALNRGIRRASGEFYLVLGADDVIDPMTIERFKTAARDSQPDIVVAPVVGLDRTLRPMRGRTWLRGGNAIAASHAVGTLIRTSLHERIGLYSNRFPSAADMHFVLRASKLPGVRIHPVDFIAGEFGSGGLSSTDRLLSICDTFRIQIELGESRWVQTMLLNFRLARAMLRR